MHLVLFHPEIPHNTGAVGRLALATGSTLHLIRPLGFSLDDKHLKRTGLDYWKDVDLRLWDSLDDLVAGAGPGARIWFLSTSGQTPHWDVRFQSGDYLVLGPETRGLPASLLERHAGRVLRIPMRADSTRSLNLATSAAIVLYEGLRQVEGPGARGGAAPESGG